MSLIPYAAQIFPVSGIIGEPDRFGQIRTLAAYEKAIELLNQRGAAGRPMYGEYGTQDFMRRGDINRAMVIEMANCSHLYGNLHIKDNRVYAEIIPLGNALGTSILQFIEDGVLERGIMGFRIRSLANLNKVEGNVIHEFIPVCIDFVTF